MKDRKETNSREDLPEKPLGILDRESLIKPYKKTYYYFSKNSKEIMRENWLFYIKR